MKKFCLITLALLGWLDTGRSAPVFTEPPPGEPPPPAVLFRTDWAPMPRFNTNNNLHAGVETEIKSDRAEFDLSGKFAVYSGAVRVKDPRMDLECEVLTVKMGSGGKFERVIAEKNVAIEFLDDKGQRLHGTGGRAVYTYKSVKAATNYTGCVTNTVRGMVRVTGCIPHVTAGYTNDVIELFDNPMLETVQGTWKGDVITLDRANNNIRATNSRMVIRPEAGGNDRVPLLSPNVRKQ